MNNKPNLELKKKVLENGACKLESEISKLNYELILLKSDYDSIIEQDNDINDINYLLELNEKIEKTELLLSSKTKEFMKYSYLERKESERVNNAYFKRKNRLKKRIEKMLKIYNECLFITMTFNDNTMNKTNQQTRRKYIQRFLNENCVDYIANIDFRR